MLLRRYAVIELSRPAPTNLTRAVFGQDGVEVRVVYAKSSADLANSPTPAGRSLVSWSLGNETVTVAVEALTHCSVAATDSAELPDPRADRERAERTISRYADLLAVTHQCARTIRSPQPSVVLTPDNDDEFGLLARYERIGTAVRPSAGDALLTAPLTAERPLRTPDHRSA